MNPEFSRPFKLDTLGSAPRTETISADEHERAELAKRFGLLALDRFDAHADLTREGDVVTAAGRISAAATQACVASGVPLPVAVDEAFALRFVPETGDGEIEEVELDAGDLDDIGYEGASIDLGEAVAQTLALSLDPFPRAPDADQALKEAGVVGEEDVGPFSALKGLRDSLKRD